MSRGLIACLAMSRWTSIILVRCLLLGLLVLSMLAGCTSATPTAARQPDYPINLIPMYGHPGIEKTAQQKSIDAEFIETVTRDKTRSEAGQYFASMGWHFLQKNEPATAMRRFNQAWLLDADNYLAHWGFGVLVGMQGNNEDAITHLQHALSLIKADDREKPRLMTELGHAYGKQAYSVKGYAQLKSHD